MVLDAQNKGAFIALQPVTFDAGDAVLSSDAEKYISKIAEMMTARKAMRINICGQAVAADVPSIQAEIEKDNRAKQAPLPKEQLPALENEYLQRLAESRSDKIIDKLTNQFGIKNERLFSCYPKVDLTSDAKPSVQLSL